MAKAQDPAQVGDRVTLVISDRPGIIKEIYTDGEMSVLLEGDDETSLFTPDEVVLHNLDFDNL